MLAASAVCVPAFPPTPEAQVHVEEFVAPSCFPLFNPLNLQLHASTRPILQVHVEEFIAAALDQRKVLNAKNINSIFGGCSGGAAWVPLWVLGTGWGAAFGWDGANALALQSAGSPCVPGLVPGPVHVCNTR